MRVSTHSRPKAAGSRQQGQRYARQSFNTQPPEGGWRPCSSRRGLKAGFNTQPPEGGWTEEAKELGATLAFQHTAARRRLDIALLVGSLGEYVSTHSRPKAAGGVGRIRQKPCRCFNTQPPEGGWVYSYPRGGQNVVSTHSRPKAAGFQLQNQVHSVQMFQHTAARRRLVTARPA